MPRVTADVTASTDGTIGLGAGAVTTAPIATTVRHASPATRADRVEVRIERATAEHAADLARLRWLDAEAREPSPSEVRLFAQQLARW